MSGDASQDQQRPIRLTLDTNLLHELWKGRSKKHYVEMLFDLAATGSVELAVTARVHEDIPAEPLASRLNELPALGIAKTASVTRLDYWVLGRDQLGSEVFAEFERELAGSGNPHPDWRDLDHLHAHMLQQRDVFLTWDRGILALAEPLEERLGIVVSTPDEFIDSRESDS